MSFLSMLRDESPNGGTFEGFAQSLHEESDVEPTEQEEEMAAFPDGLNEKMSMLAAQQEQLRQSLSHMVDSVTRQNELLNTFSTSVKLGERDIEHTQQIVDLFKTALEAHAERLVKVDTTQHEGIAQVREEMLKLRAELGERITDVRVSFNTQLGDTVKETLRNELQQQRNTAQDMNTVNRQNFQNAFTAIGWTITAFLVILSSILGFLLATHH